MSMPEGSDPACLFCRIITGEIASDIVYSNDDVVAFRDVAPQAPSHILFVPRRHIPDAAALTASDASLLGALFSAASAVARQEHIEDGGYRLVFNVGDDAGNTVPHLHLHLIGGRAMTWPPG